MQISVVILSYNSARAISRCLESLIVALDKVGGENEVFIVNNGSADGSTEIVERFRSERPDLINTINFRVNTGTTYSRNAALKKVSGDFVLILDSDAYISSESITAMLGYLERSPDVGLVAPRLLYGNGSFQLSCDKFPTLLHKLKRFVFLRQMERQTNELMAATNPIQVDYAISACWLLHRSTIEKIGLFDEKIFYSPEDVDYCLRVWAAGYKIIYFPDAEVIHDAQELSRGLRLSSFHFSHLAGLFYLFKKHRYFWSYSRLKKRLSRQANGPELAGS